MWNTSVQMQQIWTLKIELYNYWLVCGGWQEADEWMDDWYKWQCPSTRFLVARRAWAPSGSCQEAWPWRGDASFLGKRRAAPEAAEYSLTTTTAASERRRRWQHQGLFLPHPPDCPRMNELSRTRNLTRARAITHTQTHATDPPGE